MVTLYLPLALFLIVLLFPFYWMAITAVQTERGTLQLQELQPVLDPVADAGQHQASCCSRPTIRAG